MSTDKIVKLHKVVKEPLRQKILLQLGLHKKMTFNDLMKSLEIQDSQELRNQLNILEKMIIEGKHLVIKQANSSYRLTEKGQYVLDKMITYPQLRSDSYPKLHSNIPKPKPIWFKPYWITMVVATIVVSVTLPITLNIPLGTAVLILILALDMEGLASYVLFEPSLSLIRVMYILAGVPIGSLLWFVFTAFSFSGFRFWANEDFVFVFGSIVACFGIGALIGDFIGRLRNYKGPEEYQL
jgi:DNA-binding HxlR family transcriptional regulator